MADAERKGVSMGEIFRSAKEAFETNDTAEVARLLQSRNWVVVRAVNQDDGMLWIMLRIE